MVDCTDWVQCVQLGIYIPVLAAGVPLNIATLWKLFFCVPRWNESIIYLLNLILNDCLLLLTMPFKMLAYKRPWSLGRFSCSLFESFFYVNVYGSILLSVCIALDRYIALRFPFRHLRSPRKAALICAVMWVVIFTSSIPVYNLHPKHDNMSCFQDFSNQTWSKIWIVACAESVFCCSALVMALCSVQVIKILQRLRKRNPHDTKLRNNKSVKIVLSNLVVFLACFIPYHVAMLLYFCFKQISEDPEVIGKLRAFVHVSLCVSSVNCLTDGFCYYFILKENLHMALREARANTLMQEQYVQSIHTLSNTHTTTTQTHTNDNEELQN